MISLSIPITPIHVIQSKEWHKPVKTSSQARNHRLQSDSDEEGTPTPSYNPDSTSRCSSMSSTQSGSSVADADPRIKFASGSRSQIGQYFMPNARITLKMNQAMIRMRSLVTREKVWTERTRNGDVHCGIDSCLYTMGIEWIWSFEPIGGPEDLIISPSSRFLAATLFAFYWADQAGLDMLHPSTQELALTSSVASLMLALKWERDFTGTLSIISTFEFSQWSPVATTHQQLKTLERLILRTPSLYYSFPTTPFDVFSEVVVIVPYLRELMEERKLLWEAIRDGFESCMSIMTLDNRFISIRPELLMSVALVSSIRSLISSSIDTKCLGSSHTTSNWSSSQTTSSQSKNGNERNWEDDEDEFKKVGDAVRSAVLDLFSISRIRFEITLIWFQRLQDSLDSD